MELARLHVPSRDWSVMVGDRRERTTRKEN
jgi:hypothetical protein